MYPQQGSVPLQPAPIPAEAAPPVMISAQSAPIQTVISPSQKQEPVGKKYKGHFKRVGWFQVVLGALSIVLAITNICIAATTGSFSFAFIGCGIWSGIVILVCGILGLRATKDKSKCSVIAGMVMTIISAMFTSTMFALEIIGAIIPVYCSRYDWDDHRYYNCTPGAIIAIHSILVIISFTSLVVAIIHSGFTCASICCGGPSSQAHSTVVYTTPAYIQQPGTNPTGFVQIHPNSQYVQQQQYQTNQAYPNQPQYYYPQPTTSVNPYPPQSQMMAPPSYSAAPANGAIAPPVQEKQPL